MAQARILRAFAIARARISGLNNAHSGRWMVLSLIPNCGMPRWCTTNVALTGVLLTGHPLNVIAV